MLDAFLDVVFQSVSDGANGLFVASTQEAASSPNEMCSFPVFHVAVLVENGISLIVCMVEVYFRLEPNVRLDIRRF